MRIICILALFLYEKNAFFTFYHTIIETKKIRKENFYEQEK